MLGIVLGCALGLTLGWAFGWTLGWTLGVALGGGLIIILSGVHSSKLNSTLSMPTNASVLLLSSQLIVSTMESAVAIKLFGTFTIKL